MSERYDLSLQAGKDEARNAHQAPPASAVRPSKSHSTLADSIRLLRESSSTTISTTPTSSSKPLQHLQQQQQQQQHQQQQSGSALSSGHPSEHRGLQRKTRPSPLQQQSFQPKLYSRDPSFTSPASIDQPRSPRERLDALLASEQTAYAPIAQREPQTTTPYGLTSPPLTSANPIDAARKPPSHGQPRNVSVPVPFALNLSPPTSPTTMLAHRPDPRPVMHRNPSIDSAVSSTSSNATQSTRSTPAHEYKSSTGSLHASTASATGPPDVAGLIAAAGSAEAALQSLWKDRQSTLAHNSQLWRLVEKQRAMILGLNKDLERSLKEKERYRKKVKELTAAQDGKGPKPKAVRRTDSGLDREKSPSPAPADASTPIETDAEVKPADFPAVPGSTNEVGKATAIKPAQRAVPVSASRKAAVLSEPNVSPVTADSVSFVDSLGDTTSIEVSPVTASVHDSSREGSSAPPHLRKEAVERSAMEISREGTPQVAQQILLTRRSTKSPEREIMPPQEQKTPPKLNTGAIAPKLSIIEATPVPEAGSFPSPPAASKLSQRKPVPRPLNLTQPTRPAPTAVLKATEALAENVDVLEGNHPGPIERGRRRTREEDDRLREEIALKEQEARSLSKKSSKSKSKSKSKTPVGSDQHRDQDVPPTPQAPPASLVLPMAGGSLKSPGHGQKPSLTSLLSPAGSENSSASLAAHRSSSSSAPLLSPGLPLSPRPGDRPLNSPAPRFPKHTLSPAGSPRLGPTLPASPRGTPPARRPSIEQREGSDQTANAAIASPNSLSSPSAMPAPLFSRGAEQQPPPAPSYLAPPQPYVQVQPAEDTTSDRPTVDTDQHSPALEPPGTATSSGSASEKIFRGLMSEQYPGLLLPPNAIPLIDVKVFSSRMQPSRHSILIMRPQEEDPVFILGIYARSNGKQLWRLEKTIMALPALHQAIKSCCSFEGKLPDKSLFSGHAPAKIDARRAALNTYFDMLLETPLTERAAVAVCQFFSSDVIGAEPTSTPPDSAATSPSEQAPMAQSLVGKKPRREGFLTKRGKNFGGWKARYFVLDSSELKYYDSPGGPQIGIIKLVNAQIGKQSPSQQQQQQQQQQDQGPGGLRDRDDDADNQYRHAFLILEPKKKDSSSLVRHVLCAESDEERDAWVDALLQYVDPSKTTGTEGSTAASSPKEKAPPAGGIQTEAAAAPTRRPPAGNVPGTYGHGNHALSASQPQQSHEAASSASSYAPSAASSDRQQRTQQPAMANRTQDAPAVTHVTQGYSYDDAVAGEAPTIGSDYRARGLPSPPLTSSAQFAHAAHKGSADKIAISGPTNGVVIQNSSMWGMGSGPSAGGPKTPLKEKKRSIFAGFRGRTSSELEKTQHSNGSGYFQQDSGRSGKNSSRVVFGIPLGEAVDISQPAGVDVYLPAVVYRSIEYLQARGAVREEGIFRLSGSNLVIKALRDRFNAEGDVKLLDGEYYDVHAVASLLKLYLRELPTSILTREYHLDFLKLLDVPDRQHKVAAFNALVHQLPRANQELLRALCSFLIEIVDASEVNKMNVRNVGIVFAPTLNIPAPLISMFLTDYPSIFGAPLDGTAPAVTEITLTAPPPSAGIRSPRHQMYSDLPTPMYQPNQSFQSLGFQPIAGQRNTYAPEQFNHHYQGGAYPHSQTSTADGFHSLNASMHSSNSGSNLTVNSVNKKNRRESSMLGLGVPGLVQQRRSAVPIRDASSSSRHTAHTHTSDPAGTPELGVPDEVDGPMAKGLW